MAPSPKRGRKPSPIDLDSSSSESTIAGPTGKRNNWAAWGGDDKSDLPVGKTRLAPSEARRASPATRHARFGSTLEQGPTPSRGTSQSPSRSALSNRSDAYNRQASAQLLYEAAHSRQEAAHLRQQDAHSMQQHAHSIQQDAHSMQQAVHLLQQATHSMHKAARSDLGTGPQTTYAAIDMFATPLASIEDEDEQDHVLCEALHKLRAKIVAFGEYFVNTRAAKNVKAVDILCSDRNNLQLIRYIGCLAMGGPKGIDGWNELLHGAPLAAIVSGILGRALKEQVFSALWFGACPEQEDILRKHEQGALDKDGFHRTKARAAHCKAFLNSHKTASGDVKAASISAEVSVYISLSKLLQPLYKLSHPSSSPPAALSQTLREIVASAAYLSREMRTLDNVVYYWPPTFKDEEFEPARMECLYLADMIASSPYEKRTVSGRESVILKDGQSSRKQAIVRIVAFPGVVAYRQGDGDLAASILVAEKAEDSGAPPDVQAVRRGARDSPHKLTGKEGFRTRILGKSVVMLEWGCQRLLTKEAGTSVHLDALRDGKMERYEKDGEGWVELFEIFLGRHPNVGKRRV